MRCKNLRYSSCAVLELSFAAQAQSAITIFDKAKARSSNATCRNVAALQQAARVQSAKKDPALKG